MKEKKDTDKKKKFVIEIDEGDGEDRHINKKLPICLMIGTAIGCIAWFLTDSLMAVPLGMSLGLLGGVFLGSIAHEEEQEAKKEQEKEKTE